MSKVDIYKSKRYCIISSFAEDAGDLVEKVNELQSKGWITVGGVSGSSSKLFQTLEKL